MQVFRGCSSEGLDVPQKGSQPRTHLRERAPKWGAYTPKGGFLERVHMTCQTMMWYTIWGLTT